MKRAKQIITFATVATLALGSAVTAFADQSINVGGISRPSSQQKVEDKKPVAAQTTKLQYTEKIYYRDGSFIFGKYPVVTGMADLSKKIKDNLDLAFRNVFSLGEATYGNDFKASYEIKEDGTYAVIKVTGSVTHTTSSVKPKEYVNTYYVDIAAKKELTEKDYNAALEKAKEDAETDDTKADDTKADDTKADDTKTDDTKTDDIKTDDTKTDDTKADDTKTADKAEATLIPLKKYATQLGYAVIWKDDIKAVVVERDDFSTTVVIGENAYLTKDGETIKLDAAPTIVEDSTCVPASFFEKILGAKVEIGKDGSISISEVVAEATSTAKDESKEAAKEDVVEKSDKTE